MRRMAWIFILLLLGTLAFAAPRRRAPRAAVAPIPTQPAIPEPWNIPPDVVAPVAPTLDRLELDGLIVHSRAEPQSISLEASLLLPLPEGLPGGTTVVLAMAHQLRYGGIQELDGQPFREALALTGAELQVDVSPDLLTLTLHAPLDLGTGTDGGAARALELLGRLVMAPAYPQTLVESTRRTLAELGARRAADPVTATLDALRVLVFEGHPYAARLEPAAYSDLGHDGLLATHAAAFGRNRAVLTVVSPFQSGVLQEMVRTAFTGWGTLDAGAARALPPPLSAPAQARVAQPGAMMAVAAGCVLAPASAQELLGARVLARLIDASIKRYGSAEPELRMGAQLEVLGKAGFLWAWAEGRTDNATEGIVRRELARVGRGELGAREIAWARANALSDRIAALGTLPRLLRSMGEDELLRGPLPSAYRVTAELDALRNLPMELVQQLGIKLFGRGAVAVVVTDANLSSDVSASAPLQAAEPAAAEPAAAEPAAAEPAGH